MPPLHAHPILALFVDNNITSARDDAYMGRDEIGRVAPLAKCLFSEGTIRFLFWYYCQQMKLEHLQPMLQKVQAWSEVTAVAQVKGRVQL